MAATVSMMRTVAAMPNQASKTPTKGTIMATPARSVINIKGDDYYVDANYRGSLQLVRLSDLKSGFGYKDAPWLESRPATEAEIERVNNSVLQELEKAAQYRPGVVVRATKSSKHMDPADLYVITKASEKTVSIVKLGGDIHGRYVNSPRDLLEIVDLADVLK